MIGLEYIFNRSGPMTMGASQLCMFAKSDPSLELPDLQWHVQPMSMDTLAATKNHDFHAFYTNGVKCKTFKQRSC